MKKILFLLISITFIFSSCEREEEIQPTMLKTDLYGNWESVNNDNNCFTMTLSSNGQFVYQIVNCSNNGTYDSNSGLWWTEENHLVLSGNSWGLTDDFSVSGNSLEFNGLTWTK